MPFTPTHLAAAVPLAWLCRWRVPFSALAVGTMVPDIGAYFPSLLGYQIAHTMRGIVTHCLPVGLLLYYVYHGLLKRPLVDLLPLSLRDRLLPFINRPLDFAWWRIVLIAALVMIGAATHVFWDSFTHNGRWGTDTFPWLKNIVTRATAPPLRWYAILQHGSSILLLPPMIIGFFWWVLRQPQQAEGDDRWRLPIAITWTVMALVVAGGIIHWRMLGSINPHWPWIGALRIAVKNSGAVALAIFMAYCAAMQVTWWIQRWRNDAGVEVPPDAVVTDSSEM